MTQKRITRTIKGICGNCLGLGWIANAKGRCTCDKCGGTGEKDITIVEIVGIEE